MSELLTFNEFPKIARYSRDIVITEKLDGTNAQICVTEDGQVLAGSRSRWITPGKTTDNYGFAGWVKDHEDELRAGLGIGRHFGEWWGAGINRGYGLKEKRFSLFNVAVWGDDAVRPACCHVVPELYRGPHSTDMVEEIVDRLRAYGSVAAPGFTRPEGIVIFHTASGHLYKKTLEKDESPKSLVV